MTATRSRLDATKQRTRSREFQAAVAFALLHKNDVTVLADSPLVELPFVRQHWEESRALFREGVGLAAALDKVVRSVLARLPEFSTGKVAIMRTMLEEVAIEHHSISAAARRLDRSREHLSRTYWPQVVSLVAEELGDRGISGTRTDQAHLAEVNA